MNGACIYNYYTRKELTMTVRDYFNIVILCYMYPQSCIHPQQSSAVILVNADSIISSISDSVSI